MDRANYNRNEGMDRANYNRNEGYQRRAIKKYSEYNICMKYVDGVCNNPECPDLHLVKSDGTRITREETVRIDMRSICRVFCMRQLYYPRTVDCAKEPCYRYHIANGKYYVNDFATSCNISIRGIVTDSMMKDIAYQIKLRHEKREELEKLESEHKILLTDLQKTAEENAVLKKDNINLSMDNKQKELQMMELQSINNTLRAQLEEMKNINIQQVIKNEISGRIDELIELQKEKNRNHTNFAENINESVKEIKMTLSEMEKNKTSKRINHVSGMETYLTSKNIEPSIIPI
jgi:hypothetical protein